MKSAIRDYVPLLRIAAWSNKNREAEEYRLRRDVYMTQLLQELKDRIARGEDSPW